MKTLMAPDLDTIAEAWRRGAAIDGFKNPAGDQYIFGAPTIDGALGMEKSGPTMVVGSNCITWCANCDTKYVDGNEMTF
ncbi:DUF6229 family protein [Catellatospora sp. NPDC049609]|uniref:DUF6229 family protein n=1 Tax=Catellatospora sp. NPDC049609 TaxID=3155505 RepID=UPI003435CA26